MARAYTMRSRAESAEATRDRILDAAVELFVAATYDEVSLEQIAAGAEVSLPTILRKFGSKEALFLEVARRKQTAERDQRATIEPGDVRSAVRMLAERYEALMPMWRRYTMLTDRLPMVAEALDGARRDHTRWLETVFAPHLPKRQSKLRERRVAALFGATEIYVWWSWREKLGLDAAEAEKTLRETLEALVASWTEGGNDT